MKISYNWLKQFLAFDIEVTQLTEILTAIGLEVEGVSAYESIKGSLQGVVVGQVQTCDKHPNADRLRLTRVDIGQPESLRIVCGAPNVAQGQKVAVATIGTRLYNTQGKVLEIKKGKIRGEVSMGMICAEDELGIGTAHEGILVLDSNLAVGTPLSEVFALTNDYCIEIGLTPNRADAMSHFGVARDLRAACLQSLQKDYILSFPSINSTAFTSTKPLSIEVFNNKACPRYTALTVEGLTVKSSPEWLQHALKAIGITPINNVVDVSNYVLHGIGQPLHLFDWDHIEGGQLSIRNARENESLITLDKAKRVLTTEDLVICDQHKPLCLAGIMGGLHSSVTESTTNILIESAYFDPICIRKSAKNHAINTDASFRFERGIDPNITLKALQYAALLLIEIAGGKISSGITEISTPSIGTPFNITLCFANIQKVLGEKLPNETIKGIIKSLDINILEEDVDQIQMEVPSYRVDVQREIDVIEEILRIYGYNRLEIPKKLSYSLVESKNQTYTFEEKIANHLAANGFNEIMNNSLTSSDYQALFDSVEIQQQVKLINPLSKELENMRQTLLLGGLEVIAYNINRKQPNLQLYELGKTYHRRDENYVEEKKLALWTCGKKSVKSWNNIDLQTDFYFLKGSVENILQSINIQNFDYKAIDHPFFSSSMELYSQDTLIGTIGIVKSTLLDTFDIELPVFYVELAIDACVVLYKNREVRYKAVPKFPSSIKDLSLLIDYHTSFQEIRQLAYQTERKFLKNVNLFDVYEDKEKLPIGKKSYAVSFELRDDEKTLTDKQIEKTMQRLITAFEQHLNAVLRG